MEFLADDGVDKGTKQDVFQVSSEKLVGKVKEILQDASVKKVIIQDQKGKGTPSHPCDLGGRGRLRYRGAGSMAGRVRGHSSTSSEMHDRS